MSKQLLAVKPISTLAFQEGIEFLDLNILQLGCFEFGWLCSKWVSMLCRELWCDNIVLSLYAIGYCIVIMHVFVLFEMDLKLCLVELVLTKSPRAFSCIASCYNILMLIVGHNNCICSERLASVPTACA